MSLLARSKQVMIIVGISIAMNGVLCTPASADIMTPPSGGGDAVAILAAIKSDTDKILVAVNDLPTAISTLIAYCLNWTDPDKTDQTASLQSGFANLENVVANGQTAKNTIQANLVKDFLAASQITMSANGQTSVQYLGVNDIIFQSLLADPKNMGLPINVGSVKEDSNTIAYHYVKNASGIMINHIIPKPTWDSSDPGPKGQYTNYYNAVNAVQTFNGYVLSQLYADSLSNNQLTKEQNALMQQASDSSNWFAKVASENIGVVLRQILMYNSQEYVLMVQLLQTQRQQLAEQAMSNTLLIIGNKFTESQLLTNAFKQS